MHEEGSKVTIPRLTWNIQPGEKIAVTFQCRNLNLLLWRTLDWWWTEQCKLVFGQDFCNRTVHSVSLSLTKLSYCCIPRASIFLTVSPTDTSMIFLVSKNKISLLFSRNGLPISSITAVSDCNECSLYTCILLMMAMITAICFCYQCTVFKLCNNSRNLWTSHHPTSQCTGIGCKFNCPTRLFDNCVIQFVALVNRCYGWKFVSCFVYSELSWFKFSQDCRMFLWQLHHVPNVHW